jgi:hypothetical protein
MATPIPFKRPAMRTDMKTAHPELVEGSNPAHPEERSSPSRARLEGRTRKGRYDYSAALDRQMPRLTARDKAQPTAVEGDINISSTGATEFVGGKWRAK